MKDRELFDTVCERSGAHFVWPKGEDGKERDLLPAERETLEAFERLGQPFSVRAARAALHDLERFFEIEEPAPQAEHFNCPAPPPIAESPES